MSLSSCAKDSTPISNWMYALIGFLESLAIIFNQLAYQNTSIASNDLMTSFSVLAAAFLSIMLFRFRYQWTHYLGIVLTLFGLLLTSFSDSNDGTNSTLKGDLFAVAVSLSYGTVTTLLQLTVTKGGSLFAYFGWVSFIIMLLTASCFYLFSEYRIFASLSLNWRALLFYALLSLRSINSFLIGGFVRRYGSALFSIASLGSVLTSMLFDILLFEDLLKF